MRFAALLRLAAIGVALMGVLDPPVVVTPARTVDVDLVTLEADQDAAQARDAVLTELESSLGSAYAVHRHTAADGDNAPCDARRPCVIVGDQHQRLRLATDREGPAAVITLVPTGHRVDVVDFNASASHVSAAGTAEVRLNAVGVTGATTGIQLLDGAAVVGQASHAWTTDGEATVRVEWWPLDAGPRVLTARATTTFADERQPVVDQRRQAVANVIETPWPVLVYERRPSWAATFVRRALESDARFDVTARTELAPGVLATPPRGTAALDDGVLDSARVVIAGAPDALTASDVARLETFVRRRGGALVLVPDRPLTGAVVRLTGQRWVERLYDEPIAADGLRGREWLLVPRPDPFDEVLAATADGSTALVTPSGNGLIAVVGAIDAWRARGAAEGFDRFWQQTAARLAQAAGDAVALEVEPAWGRPGDEVVVRLNERRMRPAAVEARVSLHCPDRAAVPLRLWPAGADGGFEGRLVLPEVPAACALTTATGESIPVVIRGDGVPGTVPDLATIGARVAREDGVVTTSADLSPVINLLSQVPVPESAVEQRYPMRSPWWLLVFTGCVGFEWWLRRRAGWR